MKKLFFISFVTIMAFVIGCGGGDGEGGDGSVENGTQPTRL